VANVNDLAVDVDRGEEGAWIENIPDLFDIRLKVRALDCADAQRIRQEIERVTPQVVLDDPKTQDMINRRILTDAILLDWANISDGPTPVPYSIEAARRLIDNPQMKKLRRGISWAAMQVANLAVERAKADAGN
jgi:hypothetical protein